MIELWIPVTLLAAFAQNLRSALQKHLQGVLGTGGATWVRFLYAIPFAGLWCAILVGPGGAEIPGLTLAFAGWGLAGGVAQILATALLVLSFRYRNFAVATAYSKTEAVQAAVFGIVLLGDALSVGAAVGILVSLAGVIAISVGGGAVGEGQGPAPMRAPGGAAGLGLASGACFAISAVCYRAASRSLLTEASIEESFLVRAALTLFAVTVVQSAIMGAWLALRAPGEIRPVCAQWRVGGLVGLAGAVASAGWFTAMTIENVAHVRALGQIELVFTLLASWLVFRERSTTREQLGVAAIVAGILILLLGR